MERVRVIRAQQLNRRTSPKVADNRDGTFPLGELLYKVAEYDGWALVFSANDYPDNVGPSVCWVWGEYLEPVTPKGKANWGHVFTHWPTDYKTITQLFGANPQNYKRFGLPGHEGIDIRCPLGEPYYCVAPGTVVKVSNKRSNGTVSAYGWHVIVDHGNGYTTLYAHAEAGTIPVKVGQRVNGGSILAHSGNTGNSSGPHLHLTVKKQGEKTGQYPIGYVDPLPLLQHLRD